MLLRVRWFLPAGACAALALGAAHEVAAPTVPAAVSGASARAATRTWRVTLSPEPGDLALAQIAFRGSLRGARITASSLQVAVDGPFGDDYLAAAVLQPAGAGGPRLLVLLVNRPSPLLDPAGVRLRLTARRTLGTPAVLKLADPFARSATAPRPSLCDLSLHGAALSASQLRPLRSRGEPLAGFGVTGAVAQAYDAVCGLPFASAFEQEVTQPSPTAPAPAPAPVPPVGKLPGEGCVPAPGYACPAAVAGALPSRRR
jgi:hypothetical protein